MTTPIQKRIELASLYSAGITNVDQLWKSMNLNYANDKVELDIGYGETINSAQKELFCQARSLLWSDVLAVLKYRSECDAYTEETFAKWFPNLVGDGINYFKHLQFDNDFVYTSYGLRILINRYLLKNEPIQYGLLRMAFIFESKWCAEDVCLFYKLLSCGFLHISSIVANAKFSDPAVYPGEACRLIVPPKNYDTSMIHEIGNICTTVSLGVGVGLSASTIPKHGKREPGYIQNGFLSFVRRLDSCHHISLFERKPKIAIYIHMHNDTLYEAFELKHPAKEMHAENTFIGVIMSKYFLECVQRNEMWYFFSGDATLENGERLCDYYGDEYERKFKEFVSAKLYTSYVPARSVMDALVESICSSGSPYIISDDHLNNYSNHKNLGKIKTLNLCAEITNFTDVGKPSSCTLMSVNMAMYRDFPETLQYLYKRLDRMCPGASRCKDFKYPELAKYAFTLGFFSTYGLNNLLGDNRKSRELGISPLGVYDMAAMSGHESTEVCAVVSEALYKGAIVGSCYVAKLKGIACTKYFGSPFSCGQPQYKLRNIEPSSDWTLVEKTMMETMANSMLTAQAPTATTSMLAGVTESVTLPMDILCVKETESGRSGMITYGLLSNILNDPSRKINLINDLDTQIEMYRVSAPYIDQSQSTMLSLVTSKQTIFDVILKTYKAGLKTMIYYIWNKQKNETLSTVRQYTLPSNQVFSKVNCDSCAL